LNIFSNIFKHGQIIINLNDLTQLLAIFIAAISFIGSIIGFIGSIITIKGYYDTNNADKNENPPEVARRKSSLAKIKHILDLSLRDIDVPIELDLCECGEKVSPPDKMPFPLPKPVTRQLPSSANILKIFDEYLGGSFLILGDPGSGKTTLLIQLAKGLRDMADSDEHRPIPAVFHLSSWADYEQPLSEWLIDELNNGYKISRNFAVKSIKDDMILPLLDGLDEVAPEKRELCVKEINKFIEQHGSISIVVCCRSKEYDALNMRLGLSSAMCVKLLSRTKIEDHLKSYGTIMDGVLVALKDDDILWELLKTPLMLNIVTQAFKGKSAESVHGVGTLEERRTQIFDAYKYAMFHRVGRVEDKSYMPQQTEHWLSWLAKSMKQHNPATFYLEKLQPDWLPSVRQRKIVFYGAALIYGLIIGLGAFAFFSKFYGMFYGQIMGLLSFNIAIIGTSSQSKIKLYETLKIPTSRKFYFYFIFVYIMSFPVIVFISMSFAKNLAPFIILIAAIVLLMSLIEKKYPEKYEIFNQEIEQQFSDDLDIRRSPNEGVYRNAKNGLTLGLVIALTSLPFVIMGRVLLYKENVFDLSVLMWGMLLLLISISMSFGGLAFLQHFILRAMLMCNKFAPFRYEKFLDYAASLIFLRKVGGGYEFIHGMILDYFASLEPPK